MIEKTNSKMPNDFAILIGSVLETNSLDPSNISRIWSKGVDLDDKKGIIAIVVLGSDQYYAVVNMPVLVMPINGITINFGEAMQLVMSIAEIPGSSYAMSGDNLYFTYCAQMNPINETEVPKVMEGLLDGVIGVRHDLLTAFKFFYSPKTEIVKPTITEPQLPNIKMTPDEAKTIYGILLRCDENSRQIFTFLMERWVRAGYFVGTTKSSIVLDAPYGETRTRIAILLPGISQEIANLNPSVSPEIPVIVLPWNSLTKQSRIPSESIKQYQRVVEKTVPLHKTESSAHIEKVNSMDLQMGRKLLKAMSDLARSIRHDLVEDNKPFKPVTPTNIEQSLALCDAHTQAVFQKIIDEWKKANGTVLCGKVGRIDIKLKTKAHFSGNNARIERNFNLAVLACPKNKQNANIQVTWDLAKDEPWAYLDNIPEAVARYEKTLASLPGFEQKGTITRFVVDDSFQEKHVAVLITALRELKEAEANSD